MPTPPPSITPAPQPPPQRGDRATFSDRVDRWVTWMSEVPTQFQALANNVYANALEASAAITAIPPLAGNATKSLRVNADGTAMVWVQDGAALGFTPVQEATGIDQTTGTVKIGRGNGTAAALKATVNTTDAGYFTMSSTNPGVVHTFPTPVVAPRFTGVHVGDASQLTGLTDSQIDTALGFSPVTPTAMGQAGYGEVQRSHLEIHPVYRPNRTFTNALMSGKVRIVVAGDSMSEAADEEYINGWVSNFTDMLVRQIPWVEWEVINLSLGGRGLRDLQDPEYKSPTNFTRPAKTGGWDTQAWPDGAPVSGKAWRDYVRDASPDIVIMAHQENMGEDTAFMQTCWNSLKAYADTWAKVPWWCFVAAPVPTKNPAIDSGAYSSVQVGRQALADWIRATAIKEGYGLIDSNSVMRMLRDGKRVETLEFSVEKDFRFYGDTTKWSAEGGLPGTLASGVLTLPAAGQASRVGKAARDIDVVGEFNTTAGSVMTLSYRRYKGASYALQYWASTGLLQLYWSNQVIAEFTVSALTNPCSIRLKATGARHEVFYNGKSVMDVFDRANTYAGEVSIGYAAGMGGGGAISNFKLGMAVSEAVAPPYVSELDLFGRYPGDFTTNPDTLGGDGIHHLSTKGIFLTYLPAAQKFINGLMVVLGRQLTVTSGVQVSTVSAPTDGALSEIPGVACATSSGSQKTIMAHVNLSYRNTGAGAGVLQLRANGAPVASWYLLPAGGDVSAPFTAATPVDVGVGRTDFSLWWGGASPGQPAMTTGSDGGRSLLLTTTAV